MRARIPALVKPELLVWARESAGFDIAVAARKLQTKPDKLEAWERGKCPPTVSQLRKIGNLYKRPISVFFLSKPPKKFQALHDFRRFPDQTPPRLSPTLIYEIRRARERREMALDLYEMLDDSPPKIDFKLDLTDDPETVAKKLRGLLNITSGIQRKWKYFREAFNVWKTALEQRGVLVFQASKIRTQEMRGFSISDLPLPIIVINIQDFVSARIFSLLHEFAHILLREEGLCDFEETGLHSINEQKIEIFCNHVAGATLVPQEDFIREPTIGSVRQPNLPNDDDIKSLSYKYKTSREVILRRLLYFGTISDSFYQSKSAEYREEAKRRKKKTEGFAPYHLRVISINGYAFSHLVFTGYFQNKITLNDVSNYLDANLKHVPNIEIELSKKFSRAWMET